MNSQSVFVAARVLLSSVFIGYGIESLLRALGLLQGGLPQPLAAILFNLVLVIAGVLVVIGWQLRRVALALALFLLVDAFVSHPFWRYAGSEQHAQLLHFLKNFSMLGGFLLLAWVAEIKAVTD